MALEDLTGSDKFITALVASNPDGQDDRRQGDDHIRGVKNVLLNTWPNMDGPVTLTPAQLASVLDRVLKSGDAMTGDLTLRAVTAALALVGADGQTVAFRLVASGALDGSVILYNVGLSAVQVQFNPDGTVNFPYITRHSQGVRATQFVATPSP